MKKIRVKLAVIFLFIVILGIILFLYYYNNRIYIMKDKNSFIEGNIIEGSLSEAECININSLLREKVYEDDEYYGFNDNKENVDLYTANTFVKIAVTLQDNDMINLLNSKLQFLSNVNTDSMNMLNLIYYVNICEALDIHYNLGQIYNNLQKYYDNNDRLFYLNSENDSINIKITITALCCNAIKDNELFNIFDLKKGVITAYDHYTFETSGTSSLYNSGGDILYCLDVIGEVDKIDLHKHKSWFEYWKNQYEVMNIEDVESLLQYSEFFKIAKIFDKDYSNQKLKKSYDSMSDGYLSEELDYFMLINSIENIDVYDNAVFNSVLLENVEEHIRRGKLFEAKIDLQSTLYGILLADKSGFQYNKEKLQNFINQNYQLIEESRDTPEITNYLYYTIILDQIANNFNVNYNSNFIQEKIDFVLKNIKYGTENGAESIEETRKILEIIMDLQIHNVDVHITEKQRKKISKGLKSCWNREELKNSFLITDMYIISDILKLDIVKPDDFIQVHNLLLSNGGNKMKKDELMAADIFTTYKFEVCLERMNDYTCLEDKKQFAESLKIKEGIYCLYDDSEDMLIELASVLYGNTICKREIGGDKFDFNKSYQ